MELFSFFFRNKNEQKIKEQMVLDWIGLALHMHVPC